MSRKAAREIAVQIIYEYGYHMNSVLTILEDRFDPEFFASLVDESDSYRDFNDSQYEYLKSIVNGVVEKENELDEIISKYAIGWNLNRISRIARAILRVAVYEILHYDDVPTSVAINEAIELTKKYDTKETAAFVNGILGSVSRECK